MNISRFIKSIAPLVLSGVLIFGVILFKLYSDSARQSASIILKQQVQSDILLVRDYLANKAPVNALNLKLTKASDFYVFVSSRDDAPYIIYAGALTSPYELFYCKNGTMSQLKVGGIDKSGAEKLSDFYKLSKQPETRERGQGEHH